jgi:hypothetical protein
MRQIDDDAVGPGMLTPTRTVTDPESYCRMWLVLSFLILGAEPEIKMGGSLTHY